MSTAGYIRFLEQDRSESGKTRVWAVESTRGARLGTVKWFGRWRCYAFYPERGTVFEQACLRDIASFCQVTTQDHRHPLMDAGQAAARLGEFGP